MTEEAKRCVEALRDNINNGFLLVGGFNGSVHQGGDLTGLQTRNHGIHPPDLVPQKHRLAKNSDGSKLGRWNDEQ